METLGPASEIQAVSEMLAAIGEDPVEELENLPPSGNTALTTLRGTSRDFQEESYWFNTEETELVPVDGQITLPDAILAITGTDADLIAKGNRLYDRDAKTFTFSAAASVVAIYHQPWDDLPSAARRYITALAIEKFVDGFPGANAVTEARARNLMRAKVAFEKAVIRHGRYNLLNNSTIQQITRR